MASVWALLAQLLRARRYRRHRKALSERRDRYRARNVEWMTN